MKRKVAGGSFVALLIIIIMFDGLIGGSHAGKCKGLEKGAVSLEQASKADNRRGVVKGTEAILRRGVVVVAENEGAGLREALRVS